MKLRIPSLLAQVLEVKNYNVDLTYMQNNICLYIDPVYNTSEAAAKTNQAASLWCLPLGGNGKLKTDLK